MLTCAAVLIFKFYSKSVELHLISGMAVQETKRNIHIHQWYEHMVESFVRMHSTSLLKMPIKAVFGYL